MRQDERWSVCERTGHAVFLIRYARLYDEMFEPDGRPRPHARLLLETVESLSDGQLLRYKRAAERMLLQRLAAGRLRTDGGLPGGARRAGQRPRQRRGRR